MIWILTLLCACGVSGVLSVREDSVELDNGHIQLIGDVFRAHVCIDSNSLFIASRNNILASVSFTNPNDIKWRMIFEKDVKGQIENVHFTDSLIWIVFSGKPMIISVSYSKGTVENEVHFKNTTGFKHSIFSNGNILVVSNEGKLFFVVCNESIGNKKILWTLTDENPFDFILADQVGIMGMRYNDVHVSKIGFDGSVIGKTTRPDDRACFAHSNYILVCQSLVNNNVNIIKAFTLLDHHLQLTKEIQGYTVIDQMWACSYNQCFTIDDILTLNATSTDEGQYPYITVIFNERRWYVPHNVQARLISEGPLKFASTDSSRSKSSTFLMTHQLHTYSYINGILQGESDQSMIGITDSVLFTGLKSSSTIFATRYGTVISYDLSRNEIQWVIALPLEPQRTPFRLLKCLEANISVIVLSTVSDGKLSIDFIDYDTGKHERHLHVKHDDSNERDWLHFDKYTCTLWYRANSTTNFNSIALLNKDNGAHILKQDNRNMQVIEKLNSNELRSYYISGEGLVWKMKLGISSKTSEIIKIYYNDDECRSEWIILANRSLITKHLHSDMLTVLVYDRVYSKLFVYVLTAELGHVLFTNQHDDVKEPFLVNGVENWIIYTFQSVFYKTDKVAPRSELRIVMLARNVQPQVNKLVLPFRPVALSISKTKNVIATRSLLIANSVGHIYEVNWDPFSMIHANTQQSTSILRPPILPLSDQNIVNYYKLVRNCRQILSNHHPVSESKSYVVAYGFDIYSSLILPSRSFDTLKDNVMHKRYIAGILVSLVLIALATRFYAKQCLQKNAWK
ncbi:hypothetical protein GJ496_005404 [Pomphorhynchus laevis]|nr:hypothetical protein GJ496_005404 [Pomphorhynchus laevis]